MRARLGIDKTKSWADWAEEEEEAATTSKTFADAKSEDAMLRLGKTLGAAGAAYAAGELKCEPTLALGMLRLRGGAAECEEGGGGGALTEGGLARQASAHGHGQEVCMQSQRELTSQFGVSNDRAACAQKHGQPLREGFSIVKVRATRCACAISHISRDLPHAHLPRSHACTSRAISGGDHRPRGDHNLSYLARSPRCIVGARQAGSPSGT